MAENNQPVSTNWSEILDQCLRLAKVICIKVWELVRFICIKAWALIKQARIPERLQNWSKTSRAKRNPEILSHWHKLFEGLQESPQKVYSIVEEGIKKRDIPEVKVSRVIYHEKGLLSAKREYLRVQRQELLFDICAAPFGNSFFVSWWLGKTKRSLTLDILISVFIPIFGLIWVLSSRRETYYTYDTTLMFQDSVHSAVLEAVEQITKDTGIRELSELDKKPVMSDFLSRKLK